MKKQKLTAASFEKLSDAEKEAIYQECETITWKDSRPLTAKERRQWESFKRGPGRPRKGKGAEIVSVSVEKDLLNLADAYAKFKGISRSQLVGQGIRAVLSGRSVA